MGILLAVGLSFAVYMIYFYENEQINQKKEKTRILVENIVERRETRLQIIANAFHGFFKGSQFVTQDEFMDFTKILLDKDKDKDKDKELLAVFILHDDKITHSFPDLSLVGNDYDQVFPTVPGIIDGVRFLSAEFPMGDRSNQKIILGVPFDYFLPSVLPYDNYKFEMYGQLDTGKIFEYEKIGSIENTANVIFSNTQKENSIKILKHTKIFGHKIQDNYIVDATIWTSDYDVKYQNMLILAMVGIVLSITIIFLSVKTEKLKKLAEKNIEEITKLNSNLGNMVDQKTAELRKTNEELERQYKLQTEFINIAAHELRTPVQPMLSYLGLIKKGLITTDAALPIISVECKRLQRLANDILDVARIESGTLKVNVTKTRINEIIRDAISILKVDVKKDVSLITNLDETSELTIDADEDRIVQVIKNILCNSIKFTDKGHIKIETRLLKDKNQVEITVSDTGGGIPQEILPRLFEKFASKSVGETTKHGTGLGLYISKAIVASHGGEISAYNNDEGGATFVISLPIKVSIKI